MITNAPRFVIEEAAGGFQEVWYLKFNHPDHTRALWLRFTLLIRGDQSKRIAEVWAIFFDEREGGLHKVGLKNTWDLADFRCANDTDIHIAQCFLTGNATEGALHNEQHSVRWAFSIAPGTANQTHDFVPAVLGRLGLVKNIAWTVHEDLVFHGWCEVDGERFHWAGAPGMQGHLAGPKNGHSWAWGHCNRFVDEHGEPAPIIWDGLCARARIAGKAAPPLASMFFNIGGESFHLNTLRDAIRATSSHSYTGWQFTMAKNGLVFKGDVDVKQERLAGVTYEDTDGSTLYCHNAKIGDMRLEFIRPDGSAQAFFARQTAAYECVSRELCSSVELVI